MSDLADLMRAVGMSVEEAATNWVKAAKMLADAARARGEDESMTDYLAAWLRQQIDEDEIAWQMVAARDVVELLHGEPLAPRMLADVAAKRAILDSYQWYIDNADRPFAYERAGEMQLAERHVRLLAQPYAGRPGWREEWAT